jgi:uncharacterized protein (DUF2141 family)
MFKVSAATALALGTAMLPFAMPAAAAPIGPFAAACANGGPSVIARVSGLKARTGVVRVQLYASNPATFLEKKAYLQRIDVPARATAMDICVPVPKAGRYAISVRHDVNGDGKSDRGDGGGFSGNPDVSLMDLLAKRKPNLERVAFNVAAGTQVVAITLRYVQGFSFRPIAA